MKKIQNQTVGLFFLRLRFNILNLFRISIFEFRIFSKRGISLVEIVIATAILLFSFTGLSSAYLAYLRAGLGTLPGMQAAFLLEEGVEAATLLRDSGWASVTALSVDTPYSLAWSGTLWQATTSAVLVDNLFRRTVTFSDVYRRNGDKDIVPSASADPKTLDPDARKVTIRVWWGSGAKSGDKQVVTYLTNLFK